MSKILAFDTSGPSLSVALMDGDKLVYECMQQNGLTHSDSLMPLIDAALTAGRMEPMDVDCFAVVHGPGSFTGVRIGVTTAKALAHATDKPCIGINALEAIAMGAAGFDGIVCPMQDARAGQVYAAAYQNGARILDDAAIKLTAFLEQVKPMGRCCFVGDGAVAQRSALEEMMEDRANFAAPNNMLLRASNVAMLALARISEATNWRTLLPYYLRAPQAERERLAREKEVAKNG